MNENINPNNENGQRHGQWELYIDDVPLYKGRWENDRRIGYWEWFYDKKTILSTVYHINTDII